MASAFNGTFISEPAKSEGLEAFYKKAGLDWTGDDPKITLEIKVGGDQWTITRSVDNAGKLERKFKLNEEFQEKNWVGDVKTTANFENGALVQKQTPVSGGATIEAIFELDGANNLTMKLSCCGVESKRFLKRQ